MDDQGRLIIPKTGFVGMTMEESGVAEEERRNRKSRLQLDILARKAKKKARAAAFVHHPVQPKEK